MDCQFEERQFEQHLNSELLSKPNLLYVPGQVLENTLGFDAALFSGNPSFWGHFGHPYPWQDSVRPGLKIERTWWVELERELELFPKFKCNLFVQHKRPAHLTTANSKEWSDWNRSYYRYELTPHQQKALERLEDYIEEKGLVVYASPAFSKLASLWEAIRTSSLVDKTNFAQPIKLKGHDAYTYAEPGKSGKAYSDPEDIESYDFTGRLNRVSETESPAETNQTFLIETADTVDLVMRMDTLRNTYEEIVSYLAEGVDGEPARGIICIDAFCFLKKITWKVII